VTKCDKCGKKRHWTDCWYRNLHDGYYLVCEKCHKELCEEEENAEEKTRTSRLEGSGRGQ
jgi:hypothetical protein